MDTPPTDAQSACFEAGIKFGSMYHQFAGTPLSPQSAPSLAAAMADAIANQPHCVDASVEIDTDAVTAAIDAQSAAYIELTGRFFTAELTIRVGTATVTAAMRMDGDYPRMQLVAIDG